MIKEGHMDFDYCCIVVIYVEDLILTVASLRDLRQCQTVCLVLWMTLLWIINFAPPGLLNPLDQSSGECMLNLTLYLILGYLSGRYGGKVVKLMRFILDFMPNWNNNCWRRRSSWWSRESGVMVTRTPISGEFAFMPQSEFFQHPPPKKKGSLPRL